MKIHINYELKTQIFTQIANYPKQNCEEKKYKNILKNLKQSYKKLIFFHLNVIFIELVIHVFPFLELCDMYYIL